MCVFKVCIYGVCSCEYVVTHACVCIWMPEKNPEIFCSITLHLLFLRQDLSWYLALSPSNYLVYPSHRTGVMGACCFTHFFSHMGLTIWTQELMLGIKHSALAGIFPTPGKDFLEEPYIDQSVGEDPWQLGTCSLYFNSWSLLIFQIGHTFFYIIFKK